MPTKRLLPFRLPSQISFLVFPVRSDYSRTAKLRTFSSAHQRADIKAYHEDNDDEELQQFLGYLGHHLTGHSNYKFRSFRQCDWAQ
jgi:hypothetical protein